jgi:hypothetical protein
MRNFATIGIIQRRRQSVKTKDRKCRADNAVRLRALAKGWLAAADTTFLTRAFTIAVVGDRRAG